MTMTPAPLPPEEIEQLKVALGRYDVEALWCIRKKVPALLAEIEAGRAEIQGYRDWADDVKRLTRLIDVEMNGEGGAAKQASLCDLVGSATLLRQQIETDRAGAERVRDDALAEAEALAEKFAEDNGMRSDNDIRGAAREQAAEDIAAGIAALRQAAPPATRADLAQVGAQPAAAVSKAHANVFRDVEVRWGDRGFGLTVRHRVSGEVLAEIPAGFILRGLYIRPAVPSDYEAAGLPTSGAGDDTKRSCHDCGCKIPAEFDICGNCQMDRDMGYDF